MANKKEYTIDDLAKIENAVVKKYGEEATFHPLKDWDGRKEKEYIEFLKQEAKKNIQDSQNENKINHNGFFIAKKLIKDSNRECPVCNTYSTDKRDDIYMIKYECCFGCFIQYVEDREERWLSGWRPELKEK